MPTVPCSAGPTAGAYASVALASLIAGVLALDLVGADLRVPLWYENDALYYATVVKAVGEQGWWWSNPRLAMPFGQVLLDFPMPDTLSFAVLRVLEPFAGDAFLRLNLFYLLGFPLTAVTALFALCRIGAARAPAMLASVLYAVLPFRLLRGEAHVMYTAYQAFPLLLPVLVAIGTGQVDARREPGWRRGAYALAACAAVASTGGAYQPFFACLLLAALALWCVVRSGRIAAAGPALALLAFTFLVFVLNLLPSILHRVRHGRSETARRLFYEADLFGLEIASLLLPVADHRIPSFAGARAAYDLTPVGQDGAMMALGILGSAGFVVLLGALLFRRRGSPPDAFDVLAVLNATVVLVATVGGFALLFNLFVSPQLRGFNLAVVPIGMFAFAAVALLLTAAERAWAHGAVRRGAFRVGCLVLLGLGLLDQIPRKTRPDPERTRAEHARDREFFTAVERALPEGAMVFQLPRDEFPEGRSYDHLRAYLHTSALRFSHGALRGRRAQRWQQHVVGMPAAEMADTLAAAGFAGVCIDRHLGGDALAAREAELVAHVQGPVLESSDGRWAFVSLLPLGARLAALPDAAERRERALHPVLVDFGEGFVGGVPPESRDYRPCGCRGTMTLEHWLDRPQRVRLALTLLAPERCTVRIAGPDFTAEAPAGPEGTTWERDLTLPPGRTSLVLTTDGEARELGPFLPAAAFGVRAAIAH